MVPAVLGIAAIIAALPGGYLIALANSQKYSDNLKEARARLTGLYIQAIANLFHNVREIQNSSDRSIVDILSSENYLPAVRQIAEIMATRDKLVQLFNRIQNTNLYARYSLFGMILLVLSVLLPEAVEIPNILTYTWWVLLTIMIILVIYLFGVLFRSEKHFNKLISKTLYQDHV